MKTRRPSGKELAVKITKAASNTLKRFYSTYKQLHMHSLVKRYETNEGCIIWMEKRKNDFCHFVQYDFFSVLEDKIIFQTVFFHFFVCPVFLAN
jgi:hypothetical protein